MLLKVGRSVGFCLLGILRCLLGLRLRGIRVRMRGLLNRAKVIQFLMPRADLRLLGLRHLVQGLVRRLRLAHIPFEFGRQG